MTAAKIKKILESSYGISSPLNCWLKLPNIEIIYLNQDANLYLKNSELYYFDSLTNMMYISKNLPYIELDPNDIKETLKSYPISVRIDMSKIAGFISTVKYNGSGLYLNK